MSERLMFLSRLKAGERMTDLCREFEISRKTGYKFKERFERQGVLALQDQPRRPQRIPHRTTPELETILIDVRNRHPTWGPHKIKAWLRENQPAVRLPAASTVGDVLRRHGLVPPRRRKQRIPPRAGPLQIAREPNDIWCIDYKGEFRLGNGHYCYPLTLTDQFSRYLFASEGYECISSSDARAVCEHAFALHGLPLVMRSDNGSPFASRSLFGLSRLSAWWLSLGIWPERIEPGHPEQNGRHERMHKTLKAETTRPAATNLLQQQERFDRFRDEFNLVRPHEALGQRPPATFHHISPRRLDGVKPLSYPLHDDVRTVGSSGHISVLRRRRSHTFLSEALAGYDVGIREIEPDRFLVTFASLDLGWVNARENKLHRADLEPEEKSSINIEEHQVVD